MLLKYAGIPYCYEITLAAPSYSDNRRSIFRACPSIYMFRHIILPLRRDCNLSVPTTRPLSLAFNKPAASLLLLLVTMLFTSFSSVKCLESLLPHFVPVWQHSSEEQVSAWPKMRCYQREINSGGAPHALKRSYRRGDLRQADLYETQCLTPSPFTMSQVACRIETFLQDFWSCIQSLLVEAMKSVYVRYNVGTVPPTACPFSVAYIAAELFDDT